jgi:hypothetical protein
VEIQKSGKFNQTGMASKIKFACESLGSNGKPMKKIKKEIQHQIDELSDVEKLLVVDYILADLDKPDPEVDKAWAKEAVKRQKAMRSGKMKVFSYDEVMKKYLK